MAGRIRLFGNVGAHGKNSDAFVEITENDAGQALLFVKHYLDHVYVLPEQLKKQDVTQ